MLTRNIESDLEPRHRAPRPWSWLRELRGTLLVASLTLAGAAAPASADSYTVTNLDTAGPGSLAQAMLDALATPEDDEIDFAPALVGSILADGIPNLTGPDGAITIDGDSRITIYGNSPFVLVSNQELTLMNLTIDDGGFTGVYNDGGIVTLNNVTISRYSSPITWGGGGISNLSGGTTTLVDCTISDNVSFVGGGIYNGSGSTLTVIGSTLSGNLALGDMLNDGGGAIANSHGDVTIINSTISGNEADPEGPLSDGGNGGGILQDFGTMTITNSTISGNTAVIFGGGIYNGEGSTLTITNGTIAGNTAQLFGSGSGILSESAELHLGNSIVGDNLGEDCTVTGIFVDNGHNLVEDGSCITAGSNGNLDGDPMLSSLADRGGPTQTHALSGGSPALDAGDDVICAAEPVNGLDQRGRPRPKGAACDIGAFELQGLLFYDSFESGDTGAWPD